MDHRTNTSAFRIHAPCAWQPLIIVILAFPFAACARTPLAKPSPAPTEEVDCFAISTLAEKRTCLAKRDEAFIADCERMRPMSCRPYREMYSAEETLRQAEASLLQAAQQAYGGYTKDDPSYLDDLSASSREANVAWRAYREAQCARRTT